MNTSRYIPKVIRKLLTIRYTNACAHGQRSDTQKYLSIIIIIIISPVFFIFVLLFLSAIIALRPDPPRFAVGHLLGTDHRFQPRSHDLHWY